MNINIEKTIKTFKEFYKKNNKPKLIQKQYETLERWINPHSYGGIPTEIVAMKRLINALTGKPTKIETYLNTQTYVNTMTFGAQIKPETTYYLFGNETIPDHFRKITCNGGLWSSMPFYSLYRHNITTEEFETIKRESQLTIKKCEEIKNKILSKNPKPTRLEYLCYEKENLSQINIIGEEMQKTYNLITEIIKGIIT